MVLHSINASSDKTVIQPGTEKYKRSLIFTNKTVASLWLSVSNPNSFTQNMIDYIDWWCFIAIRITHCDLAWKVCQSRLSKNKQKCPKMTWKTKQCGNSGSEVYLLFGIEELSFLVISYLSLVPTQCPLVCFGTDMNLQHWYQYCSWDLPTPDEGDWCCSMKAEPSSGP